VVTSLLWKSGKGFTDAESRYPDIDKLALALFKVVSARRLRPYFQAHTIHVLTNTTILTEINVGALKRSNRSLVCEYLLRVLNVV